METPELRAAIEAILFVSSDPVKLDELAEAFPDEGREVVIEQLEEIKRTLDANSGGFILEQTAGGWRFATRPEHDAVLRKYFAKKGENRMSIAALETLAIIAYRQPVTAPEISDIRGVNSSATIRTLLERRMVRVSGRKNVVGSPFLYRTTKEFLVHFGLNDIRDLPALEEFGDLIGENINEDLVAAINAADSGGAAVEELPLAEGEEESSSEVLGSSEFLGAESTEEPRNAEEPEEPSEELSSHDEQNDEVESSGSEQRE